MRKIKSVLITLLTVIMLASLSLFVACQPNEPGENSSTNSNTTTEQSYTLTFNTDGGDTLQNVVAKKDEAVVLPTPIKTGYIFDGWYLDAEKTNKVPSNNHVVEGDVTFYAKWVQGVTITLNPNGGKLDTTSVVVKTGAKISDSLTKLIPTYEHHMFDCWLDGDRKLASSKLATENLTLTASYKVEVSVQIYTQKLDLTGYELAETKQVYAAEKTSYEYKESLQGFRAAQNEDAVTKITVDADYAKNVVKAYYDRNSYSLSFNSHYPVQDMENEVHTESNVLYGAKVNAVDSYVCDGYLLVGYSTTPGGEIEYPVNGYKKNLYNAEAADVLETTVTVERNLMLYGVWAKGYIDMFGSYDSIFYFGNENKEIYLSRGGLFFKGEVKDNDLFEFSDKNGKLLLRGKLLSNNTFCYRDANSEQRVKKFFVPGAGLDETQTMVLESYNEFTYTKKNTDNTEDRSTGSYIYDEESGDYIATFEDGPRKGETFHFIMGYAGNQGAYQVRDEEVLAMGTIYRFAIFDNSFAELKYYQAIFNGYGQIIINMGTQVGAFYYDIDQNNIMTLTDSYGRAQGTFKLTEFDGKKAYIDYNATFDRTINVRPSQTATLAMDGIGNAVYTDGTNTFTGIYTVSESEFGDYIISVTNGTDTMKFMTGTEVVDVEVKDDQGQTTTEKQQKAIVNLIDKDYAEYRFTKDTMVYGTLFLVMNEPYAGKASLVFFNPTSGAKETALVGSYTFDNTTGRYTFTTEELLGTTLNASMLPMELENIKSFTFGISEAQTVYSTTLNYWFSVTDNNDVTTSYEVTYTSTTDNSTIKAVGAIATYEYNSNTSVGLFLKQEGSNLATLSNAQGTILTCEVDEEKKTFTKYLYTPYDIVLINEYGQADGTEYIALDGKGGAVLTYLTGEVDENKKPIVKAQYTGKFELTDKTTAFGSKISVFTPDDASIGTMNLIVVYDSQNRMYGAYVERDTYKKEYRGEAGILELDGYGYFGRYTTAEGNVFNGMYRITAENELMFAVIYQNQIIYYYYIDIVGETFTVKSNEYGVFIMFDNNNPNNIYVELDGYGKAKLFTFEDVTDEVTGEVTSQRTYIDENATYTVNEENYQVTITYKDGQYVGALGTYTVQNNRYNVFMLLHEEVSFTYVSEGDWTVMTVDEIGNAQIYNKNGRLDEGSVTIIDNDLLYFTNSDQTDASLYRINTQNRTVEKIVYEERIGYFTKELNALLFTQYGFAVYNNETRYFYEKEGDTFYVYHQDPENTLANAYGFVKEEFGNFDEQITWEGKTFYKNSGFDIAFTRKEETATNYPVQVSATKSANLETLTFLPTGDDEFRVNGSVVIGGQSYNCQVVRELTETNEFKMYVYVAPFRFYITTNYTGQDEEGSNLNYFEVTAMTKEYYTQSALYIDSMDYLMYAMMGGEKPVNNVGTLDAIVTYNEAGEVASNKLNAEFLKDSSLFDRNNNVVELKDYDFTWVNSSMILVEYTGTDGDSYKLYIGLSSSQYTGEATYFVVAFTRSQELKSGDYTVKLERVLYTEAKGYTPGQLIGFELLNSEGTAVEFDDLMTEDGKTIYGFVRTYKTNAEGKQTEEVATSTFFTIVLKESESSVIGPSVPTTPGEGEGEVTQPTVIPALAVTAYESAEVTVEALTVYNKQGDERVWMEVDKNNKVICFVANSFLGKNYMPENVTYDEATKTYVITLSEKEVYTVQIVDGYIVVTQN